MISGANIPIFVLCAIKFFKSIVFIVMACDYEYTNMPPNYRAGIYHVTALTVIFLHHMNFIRYTKISTQICRMHGNLVKIPPYNSKGEAKRQRNYGNKSMLWGNIVLNWLSAGLSAIQVNMPISQIVTVCKRNLETFANFIRSIIFFSQTFDCIPAKNDEPPYQCSMVNGRTVSQPHARSCFHTQHYT